MNNAILEFYDITDQGGFEEWEPNSYLIVPNIGELVRLQRDDGGLQLWRVEDKIIGKNRVDLYCKFIQQLIEPKIK